MKLDLFRLSYGDKSTPGKLSADGIFECVTLELPNLGNHPQTSCIPEGEYPLTINFSERHQKRMAEILNVPNRTGIRIDVANFPSQLLGCIAVGLIAGTDSVEHSQIAYDQLLPKIEAVIAKGEAVTIEIHAPEEPK